MSDKKRPFDGLGAESSHSKKLKSDTPPANAPAANNGSAQSEQAIIAQRRAEVAAKLAAMRSKNPALAAAITPSSSARPGMGIAAPVPRVPASLPSKVVYNGTPSPALSAAAAVAASSPSSSGAGGAGAGAGVPSDLLKKIQETQKKFAEARLPGKDNPYLAMAGTKKKSTPPETPSIGAGLNMAAHPLLLEQTTANARNQPSPTPTPSLPTSTSVTPSPNINPYTAAAQSSLSSSKDASGSGSKEAGGFEGAPRERAGRKFHFNPKGKYVQLGNQMRQEAQLEALRQRIAENARKAGIDGSLDIEKAIKRAPPPAAEWWDEGLLPNKNYSDIDTLGLEKLNIRNPASPITIYIQHPIPIPAPNEKNAVELKPLMLTKKEQKKMRKLKRKAELQDKRDRIRMGLLPPDPPKVRIGNLMKVLTSDAIQDPTRVEARVRREVAMRKHTHEKANAERKLAPDERRAKLEQKKMDEDKKGIFAAVFKVKNLEDPAMQFKVRRNADQMGLTGVCIFGPGGGASQGVQGAQGTGGGGGGGGGAGGGFNLVYVEGGKKYVKNYKRLMMVRIAWTEPARPRAGNATADDVELENPESDVESGDEGPSTSKAAKPKAAGGEEGVEGGGSTAAQRLADNKCYLVWEGLVREREFNSFKARNCPTDRDAKEVLGERLRGYWDMAKNWKPEEEELY